MIVFKTPKRALVWTEDFRNVLGAEPTVLRRDDGSIFRVPSLTPSDLVSTPCPIWPKYPPFGPYARAGRVHDDGYRGNLERQQPDADPEIMRAANAMRDQAKDLLVKADALERGCWTRAMLTKDQCDSMFLDCMVADGVSEMTRAELYNGVHFFGWRSFMEDREQIVTIPPEPVAGPPIHAPS